MRFIYLLILVLILSACATPYQSEGFAGGYSETQLDVNVFQVSFSGNAFTSRKRVADLTLLRSAELTLENGYSYFVIIDAKQYSNISSYTTPTTTYGSATAYGNTAYGSATSFGGQTYQFSKPSTSNRIVCFNGKPKGFSYNAKFIVNSIKGKYQLNEPINANSIRLKPPANAKPIKLKPPVFGADVAAMSGELKAKIKIKNGLLIKSVTNNSPAFDANLLKGDILLQIGNVGIDDIDTLNMALKVYESKAVSIIVNRDGKIITKIITLNARY